MGKYKLAEIREIVRTIVLDPANTSYELDDIRLDVAAKLVGTRSWGTGSEQQVYTALQEMTARGELVKEGGLTGPKNWRSRSPVRYYTPAKFAEVRAERERKSAEREQARERWAKVYNRLTELGFTSPASESVVPMSHGNTPALSLLQWERLADLATIALGAKLPVITSAREALEGDDQQ